MTKLFIFLFIFSCLGALLSGLLGIGGGIVFVPLLDFFYSKSGLPESELPKFILANSIGATFLASSISTFKHYRNGARVLRKSSFIASTAIPFSLGVTYTIAQGEWYKISDFKTIFLCLLLLVGLKMMIPLREKKRKQTLYKYLLVGMITGTVAALSGLGGGVVMVPLLVFFCGEKLKTASQISISTISMLTFPNVVYYLLSIPPMKLANHIGYLNFFAQVVIFIAVLIFSPLGVQLARNLSSRTIQIIFALLIFFIVFRYAVQIIF